MESIAIEVVHLGPSEKALDMGQVTTKQDAERRLRDIYLGMLTNSAPRFGRLLTDLTIPDRLPAAFHCAVGKDRTGMVAALLLSSLGVDRQIVLDDYELTGRWRRAEDDLEMLRAIVGQGIPERAAIGFLGAPRWAMSDALSQLDERSGGIEAYLCGPAGMELGSIDALRSVLTA